MPVVLHIGLAKTGTTFLQEWLKHNQLSLESSGIGVLHGSSAHRLAVAGITSARVQSRADIISIQASCQLERTIGELQSAVSRFASVVVSSEYFSICTPSRTAEILNEAGIQVDRIVCYLRRQDILSASGYAQEVKSLGRASKPWRISAYTSALDWNLLQDQWRIAFPSAELVLNNYDNLRVNNMLLLNFKSTICDRSVKTIDLIERENPGLSAEMTEVARILNARGTPFDLASLLSIQARSSNVAFGYSREVTKRFEAFFLEGNQRLALGFPGVFDDFATPGWEPGGVDMTDRLAEERLAEILGELALAAPSSLGDARGQAEAH